VTVLGFVEDMAALLRAADALVTATAGLSCIEARLSAPWRLIQSARGVL
jgi:hypothetical protein